MGASALLFENLRRWEWNRSNVNEELVDQEDLLEVGVSKTRGMDGLSDKWDYWEEVSILQVLQESAWMVGC